MSEIAPIFFLLLTFGAVVAAVFGIGRYVNIKVQMQRRLPAAGPGGESPAFQSSARLYAFIAKNFDERRFGVDNTLRGKLRLDLLRAGFFRNDALNIYIFSRLALVIVLPLLAYLLIQTTFTGVPLAGKFAILLVSLLIAILGADAYLSRCKNTLLEKYRRVFPDLLDLLTVCVDAGLSLEAGLDRVTGESVKQNRELGLNLMMVTAEMRAGRSTVEALESFSERVCLDEARSLVLVLRQSVELGSDVGEALHVFSDEMREKRLLRAEEAANKLPVKMTLPMGLFIFPVILLVIMLPIGIRLATTVFK
jgi:tight adherence protein C